MELINKQDYSYMIPRASFKDVKVFFLSKELGIEPLKKVSDYPAPPPFSILTRIAAYFPIDVKNLTFMNQIHSDGIVIKNNKKPSFPTADAMITNLKGVGLAIKTADCVPIFLYDDNKKVAAAIHAGWRGTALKIVKKVIKKLEQEFDVDVNTLYAFVGPAINQQCYEVGKDVYEHFGFLGKSKNDFFYKSKSGKFLMNLKGINVYMLENYGLDPSKIEVSDICTHCQSELFYSYRRDREHSGRNISFIVLT